MKSDPFNRLAKLMFKEYNEVASEYEVGGFHSVDEVVIVLTDNMTEDDCMRLEQDDLARMALAGFIAAMMTAEDMKNTFVVLDGEEGGDETTH